MAWLPDRNMKSLLSYLCYYDIETNEVFLYRLHENPLPCLDEGWGLLCCFDWNQVRGIEDNQLCCFDAF